MNTDDDVLFVCSNTRIELHAILNALKVCAFEHPPVLLMF